MCLSGKEATCHCRRQSPSPDPGRSHVPWEAYVPQLSGLCSRARSCKPAPMRHDSRSPRAYSPRSAREKPHSQKPVHHGWRGPSSRSCRQPERSGGNPEQPEVKRNWKRALSIASVQMRRTRAHLFPQYLGCGLAFRQTLVHCWGVFQSY